MDFLYKEIVPYNYQYNQPTPQPQTNPTATTQNTKDFGASQFNIDPFMQPYPFQQDEAQSAEFRGRFGNWLSGLETPEATRERYENRYGYQPLREQYQQSSEMLGDLGSAIQAKPEQVLGRGRETIMTSGQIENITSKEVGDLMKVYSNVGQINEQQGRRLASIEQNMNDASQLEMAQQQKMMTPWLQEYQDINIMQAKKFSGWSVAGQFELDRLLNNAAAGLSWTSGEADRASSLAIAEAGFKNTLEQIKLQGETENNIWKNTEGISSGVGSIFESYGF